MTIKRLNQAPALVSAGAIYPYSDDLLEKGMRTSAYGDPYNMFSVIGGESVKRILVPRNMAPFGSKKDVVLGMDVNFKSKFVPRNSEQSRIIAESTKLLIQGDSFITEAPTGSGKGAMAMDVIARIGKKTLVVVTKEDIRDQWVASIKKFLGLPDKDIGIIQGDTFQVTGKKIVIAMVHSIAKEDRYPAHQLREFGLCVLDEIHRMAADQFSQVCFRVPARLRWGLSATPTRKDGRTETLLAHIGEVKVVSHAAPMTPKVISRRSPWKVPLTRIKDRKTGLAVVGPIPHTAGKCGHIITMLSKCHPRNAMIAEFAYAAFKKGRHIIIQSDRLDHLDTLSAMIQKLGVSPAEISFYVGGLTSAQREVAKHKRIIMATFSMTAEATDIPWLDTLVMGTPKSDVRQIVGRILRIYPEKQQPIVFDLIDDSSPVFNGYWNSRREWYASVNAEITRPVSVIKASNA